MFNLFIVQPGWLLQGIHGLSGLSVLNAVLFFTSTLWRRSGVVIVLAVSELICRFVGVPGNGVRWCFFAWRATQVDWYDVC